MVGRLAAYLLGGHVSGCAHHRAWVGVDGLSRLIATGLGWPLRELGKTEIQNFDPAIFGDEQILWLQIAMNDALLMSYGQSMRDLNSCVNGFFHGQRAAIHLVAQRVAFE